MLGTEAITPWADVIDSREVIERIEFLESDDELTEDEIHELAALHSLASEGESATDEWPYGATLVNDSYFEDYARELAEDIHGNAISEAHWPFTNIDWEGAARDLQMDYTSVSFYGVTFWVR